MDGFVLHLHEGMLLMWNTSISVISFTQLFIYMGSMHCHMLTFGIFTEFLLVILRLLFLYFVYLSELLILPKKKSWIRETIVTIFPDRC